MAKILYVGALVACGAALAKQGRWPVQLLQPLVLVLALGALMAGIALKKKKGGGTAVTYTPIDAPCCVCEGSCMEGQAKLLECGLAVHVTCLLEHWRKLVRALKRFEQIPIPGHGIGGYLSDNDFVGVVDSKERKAAEDEVKAQLQADARALEQHKEEVPGHNMANAVVAGENPALAQDLAGVSEEEQLAWAMSQGA